MPSGIYDHWKIRGRIKKRGYKLSKEHKEKIGQGLLGRKVSKATREKISKVKKERIKSGKTKMAYGEASPQWKGDKAKYRAKHAWINKWKPKPDYCERCGKQTSKLECHSISGRYLRILEDWKYVCKKCHVLEDKERRAKQNGKANSGRENQKGED